MWKHFLICKVFEQRRQYLSLIRIRQLVIFVFLIVLKILPLYLKLCMQKHAFVVLSANTPNAEKRDFSATARGSGEIRNWWPHISLRHVSAFTRQAKAALFLLILLISVLFETSQKFHPFFSFCLIRISVWCFANENEFFTHETNCWEKKGHTGC